MTSGQAHVPSGWSREAMTSAPYQLPTYEAAPANNYPAIPNVAPAPVQYAPQPQYEVATYSNQPVPASYPNQNYAPAQQNFYTAPGYTPNQQLAHPNQESQKSNKNKLLLGGIAATAAAAVMAGGLFLGLKGKNSEEGIQEPPRGETTISSTELPPLDMYSTDIRTQDYARQLDVVVPFLEEHRKDSASTFNSNELPSLDGLTGDIRKYQEIFNNFSYDIKTASLEENTTLGRNLLSGVYSPTAASMDSDARLIGNGQGGIASRKRVDAVSQSFKSGTIDLGVEKIDINSETVLVNVMNLNSNTAWNVYVSMYKSQDGRHTTPAIVGMVEYGHSNFIPYESVASWNPVS